MILDKTNTTFNEILDLNFACLVALLVPNKTFVPNYDGSQMLRMCYRPFNIKAICKVSECMCMKL